ncbi:SDR family oxidoreductase [Pseudomonas sp. JUb52]|uniref:SDR family oxidoreductase n=1 Tax=Pseudomonas sp. JUb52 TaxID=2485127 RepID=UPI001050B738|nr:SDR family oxidoreductase [Pseudomonas sp. JUb52]TCQ92592.1 3-oxoacyl-[acyl-carrier protein] reductase [Pseudomonas sp. JUb52]
MTTFDFRGRQVLVTGGAQGIGRALVEGFARAGARVRIADLQAQAAAALAAELTAEGLDVEASGATDLAVPESAGALLADLERLDVVVHNAAYFPLTDFAAITPVLLERTLAVNLAACFWLAQAAIPLMRAQGGGSLLITSSVTGPRFAYPGLAHYAASKAGVNGFIRAAALELAADNIRVNGVEPGMFRTPAMDNLGDDANATHIASGVPLGRLGEPQDIAAAMLFLASDAARYVTGQTLVVDGGAGLAEVRPGP